MKWTADPRNATHLGKITTELFIVVPELLLRCVLSNSDRIFVDTTVNVCKWIDNKRGGFIIHFFNTFIRDFYNKDLLKCEIAKGAYLVRPARPNIQLTADVLPAFIPFSSKVISWFNVTYVFKSKSRKSIQVMGTVTEIYDVLDWDELFVWIKILNGLNLSRHFHFLRQEFRSKKEFSW